MSKPVLLDLFCGDGGAAMGYHRAGFTVIGIDSEPHPRYPFRFVQTDWLAGLAFFAPIVDVIHGSPPCHDHSNVSGRNRKAKGPKGTGWMLPALIEELGLLSLPWVVENVETAVMPEPKIRLCGSSFGLYLRRHRWFCSNHRLTAPPCDHSWQTPRFRSLDSRRVEGAKATVVGVHGHLNYPGELDLRQKAMGIDWMPNDTLVQAIPPAYTEHIGKQLRALL